MLTRSRCFYQRQEKAREDVNHFSVDPPSSKVVHAIMDERNVTRNMLSSLFKCSDEPSETVICRHIEPSHEKTCLRPCSALKSS